MPFPQAPEALARFTVLDLTRVVGPHLRAAIGRLGRAEWVKVEMPPDEKGGEGMV